LAGTSGAGSVGVGAGVETIVPPSVVGEVDGELGTNGPTIHPRIMMHPMPKHPMEDFFVATCLAYAVGVTLFGNQDFAMLIVGLTNFKFQKLINIQKG